MPSPLQSIPDNSAVVDEYVGAIIDPGDPDFSPTEDKEVIAGGGLFLMSFISLLPFLKRLGSLLRPGKTSDVKPADRLSDSLVSKIRSVDDLIDLVERQVGSIYLRMDRPSIHKVLQPKQNRQLKEDISLLAIELEWLVDLVNGNSERIQPQTLSRIVALMNRASRHTRSKKSEKSSFSTQMLVRLASAFERMILQNPGDAGMVLIDSITEYNPEISRLLLACMKASPQSAESIMNAFLNKMERSLEEKRSADIEQKLAQTSQRSLEQQATALFAYTAVNEQVDFETYTALWKERISRGGIYTHRLARYLVDLLPLHGQIPVIERNLHQIIVLIVSDAYQFGNRDIMIRLADYLIAHPEDAAVRSRILRRVAERFILDKSEFAGSFVKQWIKAVINSYTRAEVKKPIIRYVELLHALVKEEPRILGVVLNQLAGFEGERYGQMASALHMSLVRMITVSEEGSNGNQHPVIRFLEFMGFMTHRFLQPGSSGEDALWSELSLNVEMLQLLFQTAAEHSNTDLLEAAQSFVERDESGVGIIVQGALQ